MILIDCAVTGRSGWIIARDDGTARVVGQLRCLTPEGEQPEEWKAWLWGHPGQYPPRGMSVPALTRVRLANLRDALRTRAARRPWWGDDPDPETVQGLDRLEAATAERTGRTA